MYPFMWQLKKLWNYARNVNISEHPMLVLMLNSTYDVSQMEQ